jgi:hypothetical protein
MCRVLVLYVTGRVRYVVRDAHWIGAIRKLAESAAIQS